VTSSIERALPLLRAVPLFAAVPELELRAAAERLRPAAFAAGDAIVREGAPGDAWYLVAAGRAAVVSRDMIGAEVTLAEYGPGGTFGEAALVTGRPRSATVVATEPTEAFVLAREDFLRLEERCPELATNLRRHVARIEANAFLRKASVFAHLPPNVVERIAAAMTVERRLPGAAIVRRGELGDRFYLVRSGRLEVLAGNRRLRMLGPGDCFGEVALLGARRRTATVLALDPTELLSIGKEDFDRVVGEHATVARQLAELARIRVGGAPVSAPPPVDAAPPPRTGPRARPSGRAIAFTVLGLAAFGLLSALVAGGASPVVQLALLVVGSLVGPVAFVAFLADSELLPERPWRLAVTFVSAAALGIPAATAIEVWLGVSPGALGPALAVALIEEAAKLLGVAWLLVGGRGRFRLDGAVYGAAAGMGFAALESLDYAVGRAEAASLVSTLWVRALLSPFGHGTWTAIVCAALWRAKGSGRPRLDPSVVGAFLLSAGLHGLWDWQPVESRLLLPWFALVGLVGLATLAWIVTRGNAEEASAVVALNPALGAARVDGPRLDCPACGQAAPPGTHYCPRCGGALRRDRAPR